MDEDQGSLFDDFPEDNDEPREERDSAPYVAGSDTSKAAAEDIEPKMGTLRAKVLAFLRENGGLMDEQMQDQIPMAASTQRPRRIELVNIGLVRDSRRKGLTRAKKEAVIWEAVEIPLR